MRFSSEKADKATRRRDTASTNASKPVGMPVPEVYSAELSEFVFAAGVKLLKRVGRTSCISRPPTTCSTSTRPARRMANAFYEMIDGYLAELDALGCGHRASPPTTA